MSPCWDLLFLLSWHCIVSRCGLVHIPMGEIPVVCTLLLSGLMNPVQFCHLCVCLSGPMNPAQSVCLCVWFLSCLELPVICGYFPPIIPSFIYSWLDTFSVGKFEMIDLRLITPGHDWRSRMHPSFVSKESLFYLPWKCGCYFKCSVKKKKGRWDKGLECFKNWDVCGKFWGSLQFHVVLDNELFCYHLVSWLLCFFELPQLSGVTFFWSAIFCGRDFTIAVLLFLFSLCAIYNFLFPFNLLIGF